MSLQVNEEMNYQKTVEKYSNMVYRLAYFYTNSKYDADDIYQDVFLKYLQNKKQYENEEHKKAWLIKVTINSCKKVWLSSWKRKIVSLNDNEIKFEMEDDIGLYNEIKKLQKKYRAVIHLFYYEQYSIKDISKVLGQKESTIRTWLTRARKILKNQIKEDDFNV